MREIRQSGSEGGARQTNASFLPLSGEQSVQHSGRLARNPLALRRRARQSAAHQGGLAELVDALDSKSSSNE